MMRVLEPELLDTLPADDPAAVRSRADLRRLNRVMGTVALLRRPLDRLLTSSGARRIVEIGCGDGSLMLRLAEGLSARHPGLRVDLLDQAPVVAPKTLDALTALGWSPRVVTADVFAHFREPVDEAPALIVANLFLHHFEDAQLSALFAALAPHAAGLLALEPRRSGFALLGARLVGLLGCNAVTRHDAVASVRAGFRETELTALWPGDPAWRFDESTAGLFSHRLIARRAPP